MNTELDINTSNITNLRITYIIHLIIYAIIIIFNFILIMKLYWLKNILYILYLSITIFIISFFIIPIIPFIYIILKKLTKKLIRIFQIISMIFNILVCITGLSFIFILMVNALESQDFCQDCSFNLPNSYINTLYIKYKEESINNKELKEQCENRRCIFNSIIVDTDYQYEYICNYDPSSEFYTIRNKSNNNETINQIFCNKIENEHYNYDFQEKTINNFLEMCHSYNEYYICQRITEPKKYILNEDYICPKKNYLSYLIAFCLISVILNLIVGFIPWRVEYINFKNLINEPRGNNDNSKSQNSTQNSSKINNEIEENFKKEHTKIIIVYNKQKYKNKGNDNNSNNENKSDSENQSYNDNSIKLFTITSNNNNKNEKSKNKKIKNGGIFKANSHIISNYSERNILGSNNFKET